MQAPPLDADRDPEPVAPIAPGDDECCGNGCDPCIFDFYGFEQERYFKALREWKERQAARQASGDPAASSSPLVSGTSAPSPSACDD